MTNFDKHLEKRKLIQRLEEADDIVSVCRRYLEWKKFTVTNEEEILQASKEILKKHGYNVYTDSEMEAIKQSVASANKKMRGDTSSATWIEDNQITAKFEYPEMYGNLKTDREFETMAVKNISENITRQLLLNGKISIRKEFDHSRRRTIIIGKMKLC